MAFLDRIGGTITSKSQEVTRKAKELAEISRMNAQMNEEKEKIRQVCLRLGEQYFQDHQDLPEDMYGTFIGEIKGLQEHIEQLNKEIMRLKNVRICMGCGGQIPAEAVFCPACGVKNDVRQVEGQNVLEELCCPNCGTKVKKDSSFCTNCGCKLDECSVDSSK